MTVSLLKKENKNLTSKDAFELMLGGNSKKDIKEIEIRELVPFYNQPFKPYKEEQLQELAGDIKANGILSPVIVRPYKNKYQILAGHNRVNASELAGLETVPCFVKDVDEDTALLILVNSNLFQRQELLPSEKAFAYKIQREASKRQGFRNDIMPRNYVSEYDDESKQEINENIRQIQRYIRLTYLIPELLQMVDDKKIKIMVGVNISFLENKDQIFLYKYLLKNYVAIDTVKSELIKAAGQNGELTESILDGILYKKPSEIRKEIKIPVKRIKKYFPDCTPDEAEERLFKILEEYFNNPKK